MKPIQVYPSVPSDWQVKTIGELCNSFEDGDWIESKDQGGTDFRLIQISNIGLGEFIESGNYRYITKETFTRLNCQELKANDVLIARMPDPIGRSMVWDSSNPPSITAVDVCIAKTGDLILPYFLSYFLNTPQCLGMSSALMTGTSHPRTPKRDLSLLELPYPNLQSQKKIVYMLRTIDDLRHEIASRNGILESICSDLFKSWFIDFDPVKAKTEGRAPSGMDEILFPDSFEDSPLGPIPTGWQVKKVSDLPFRVFSGGTPSTGKADFWDGGLAWLSSGETRNRFITSTERKISIAGVENSSTKLARKGSTVIASAGQGNTRGQTSMLSIQTYVNQSIIVIEPTGPKSFPFFIFYNINRRYDELRRISDSNSIRGSITTLMIKEMQVITPPDELIQHFESTIRPINQLIEMNLRLTTTLSNAHDALLPRLMSGELRVEA